MEKLFIAIKNNKWPKNILERLHPYKERNEFSGSTAYLPTPIQTIPFMFGGEMENASDMLQVLGYPIATIPKELWGWAVMETRYKDGHMNMSDEFTGFGEMMANATSAFKRAHVRKEKNPWKKRPDAYQQSKKDFGNTSSYPSAYASMLVSCYKSITSSFNLSEEQTYQLQNAIYIAAMLKVMAGHNHRKDVLDILSIMW